MKKFVLLSLFILIHITASADKLLQRLYPQDVLEKVVVAPTRFAPVPTASSVFWKEILRPDFRNSYVSNGKRCLPAKWAPIPPHVFREFSVTGNRSHYESMSFQLRRNMACLAMAEIMSDSSMFINDIVSGLHYFVNETWWGIPAHYPLSEPDPELQEVDLFNAEAANLLVWVCYMLEERISKVDDTICPTVRKEVKRRILQPAREKDYAWKKYSWNHNTWTCANWLSCILFCEDNREQQIKDIEQVLQCLDIFIDGYTEDGGCDEGPYYWDRAAASLFECFQLLSLASEGNITLPDTDKIKAMASYLCNMYIGNGKYVNFSDTYNNMTPNINILYPFGVTMGNQTMKRHAAFIAKSKDFIHNPMNLYNKSGNYPSLSRELCFLRLMPTFENELPEEPNNQYVWLQDTEIFVARNKANMFIAAKGGNNNENHNHNDIGNFIVYVNKQPLFVDLGMGEYNATTFSNNRYTMMNTRSAYHNVPLINGQEQEAGSAYRSLDAHSNKNYFSLDIANAYSNSAKVKRWERQFLVSDSQIIINEHYVLRKSSAPTQLILMTSVKPQLNNAGDIIFKMPDNRQYELLYPKYLLKPEIEKVEANNTNKASWGNSLYRIHLQITSPKKENNISLIIKERN